MLAGVDDAVAAGVDPANLMIDPGLGFAKTAQHNWALLHALPELVATGIPVLLGASRKRFLGALLAEPARAAMLLALIDGTSRPAGELAKAAGIGAATGSAHLKRLLEGGLLAVHEQGRHRYYRLANDDVAALIEALALTRARVSLPEPAGGDRLEGVPLSAGVAEGPALVLTEPAAAPPEGGYVLVCPSTDPAWVPLFVHAKALVMETGGVLSHGAIVAREFGLPAVAGLPGATGRIKAGQMIRVDGGRGTVTIVVEDAAS